MLFNKYINNISGLQLFQLLRFGTLLLISIVFAKSTVPTEAIGNYELFLFITALLCSFWINGLIQAFLPLFKNNSTFNDNKSKSPEIFNAFILISCLSIIIIIALVVFRNMFSEIVTKSGTIPYFNLLLLYIFFSCPSYLIEYIYLLKNKPKSIIIYGIISFSVQLVLVALPVIMGMGMELAVTGLVVTFVLRYLWLLVQLKRFAHFLLSFKFLREHIHYAWPLVFSALLGSSATYVDGFLVLNFFDSSTFAIFRYGAKEFPLVVLMANALSNAMIADFSDRNNLNDALRSLKKRTAGLMNLLFPVTVIFLVFSQWLYPKVFNPDFLESASIFNIYLLLIMSRLIFPHTILIGFKKNSIVMYASFAELMINIILSLIFINKWGIEGVALATVIAFTIQKVIWIIYNKSTLGISPEKYIPVRLLGIYSFIILLTFFIMY